MTDRRTLGRRFWRLWSAIGVSSVGDGMVLVALPMLALGYTRNAVAIAGVLMVDRLPAMVAALPFGALADRVNRRRLIVTIELTRFAAIGTFALVVLAGDDSLPVLYVTAFLLGTLNIGFDVVSGACLPSMVATEDLVGANAHLFNAELTGENMIGQALGGAALAAARFIPFAADAVSFVASAALLSGAIPDNPRATGETSAWHDLRAGLGWFLANPVLRLVTAVIASLAFCQAMVLGVLVLYSRDDLHLDASGYGLLLAVASVGNVIGALTASRVHRRLGGGAAILGVGVLAAAVYPALALTGSALVAAGALMAESAAVVIGNTAARSLRQSLVPAEMQGRAASAYTTVIISCFPIGGLAGGVLTAEAGIRTAFLAAAGLQLAVLLLAGPRLLSRVGRAPAGPASGSPAGTPPAGTPAGGMAAGEMPAGGMPAGGTPPRGMVIADHE